MGRCHEFGLQISEGCDHEMLAGENECTCAACGIACGGQFAGCPDVWARGQPGQVRVGFSAGQTATLERVPAGGSATTANGPGTPVNGAAAEWPPEPPLPVVDSPLTVAATARPRPDVRPAAAAPFTAADDGGAKSENGTPAPAPAFESVPPSAGAVADVTAELKTVTESLKLQQSMLGELLSGLTRQQAMMAELLDARHAELRLAMVAESLPDSVAEAVTKSFAANQEELTEAAVGLAKSIGMDAAVTKALKQAANRSDDKFEELCERLDKLVAKAMRAGARQPQTRVAPARATPLTKKTPAAKARASTNKATTARKAQPAKKTSRTSAQGTRPSRRSLGS
ncbi:MAG TPA: hypothetical protein VM121_08040 [Acidimicrobiales bacterium]|nr:hypothetical protein [Acidimicrobiales bacterium]